MKASPENMNELFKKIDSIFENHISNYSPGIALGIVSDGQLCYSKGFGLANLENNIPITDTTVFRVASVSKQFTAVCILLLEEQGLVSLSDSLVKYFPELPKFAEKIKIIHLLNHTSGIKEYLELFYFAGYSFKALDLVREDLFLEMVCNQKSLNFEPGTRFLYSNSGYVLLALLVERITGKTLKKFADESIFTPLNMNQTHFHDNFRLVIPNRAIGYTIDKQGEYLIFETSNELVGDGALFTTLNDLVLWDRNFLVNRLGNKTQFLTKNLSTAGILADGTKIKYGLGLRISNYKGIPQIYHSGSIAGFRTTFMQFPDKKLSIICLSNYAVINPEEMSHKVFNLLLSNKDTDNDVKKIQEANKQFIDERIPDVDGYYLNLKTRSVYSLHFESNKLVCELYGTDPLFSYTKTEYQYKSHGVFNRITGLLEPLFEFSKEKSDSAYNFTAFDNSGEKIDFEKIVIPEISLDELKGFSGTYYSEELDTNYYITVNGKNLRVMIKRIGKLILEYLYIGDKEFVCNQGFIKFVEKQDKIISFLLSSYQISEPIHFARTDI